MNDLANFYLQDHQVNQAIQLQERVLSMTGTSIQTYDPRVFTILNNLAGAYANTNRFEDSFRLLGNLQRACEGNLPPDHPVAILTIYNLGRTYWQKGQAEKARPLFERVYKNRKQQLGDNHPVTLQTLNDFALAVLKTRDFSKAIPMFEEVVRIRHSRNESNHPETFNTLNNLGTAYMERGRERRNKAEVWKSPKADLEKSVELLELVRTWQEANLRPYHPATLTTANNLARAHQIAGNLKAALSHFERAEANGIESIKYDHPFVQKIIPNTIAAYEEAEQWGNAESWRRKWLRAWSKHVPEKSTRPTSSNWKDWA